MEQSIFKRGDIDVIGIRGLFPNRAGLCHPVYHRKAKEEIRYRENGEARKCYLEELYLFGDEILCLSRGRHRSSHDIYLFVEKGVVTRLPYPIRVDAPVVIVCFTAKTEEVFSRVLPRWWREGREPMLRKRQSMLFYAMDAEQAIWWLKHVAILIWNAMDMALRASAEPEMAATAEDLGWTCWEMLTWGIPPTKIRGFRRETMVRIVAARVLQPQQRCSPEGLVEAATKSLGLACSAVLADLVDGYLRTGMVTLP